MRSNLRRCSDAFEIACWNGEVVRVVFTTLADGHGQFPVRPYPTEIASAVGLCYWLNKQRTRGVMNPDPSNGWRRKPVNNIKSSGGQEKPTKQDNQPNIRDMMTTVEDFIKMENVQRDYSDKGDRAHLRIVTRSGREIEGLFINMNEFEIIMTYPYPSNFPKLSTVEQEKGYNKMIYVQRSAVESVIVSWEH